MAIGEPQEIRILHAEDNLGDLILVRDALEKRGYKVHSAPYVRSKNKKDLGSVDARIWKSIVSKKPYTAVISDLNLGAEKGVDLTRRVMDNPGTNVIILTGYNQPGGGLTFEVDAGVIKTGDMTETANDLVSALEDLLRPKRINSRPVSVQANLWALTGHLSGITELKKLSMKRIKAKEGQGGGAEKHTFFTTETPEHLVNTVVYRGPPGDDSVYIGLESSLGCGVRCRFCKNHRYRVDGKGKICPFIRNLTHGELDSQAYLASTFSPMVERVLRRGCKARLVFNFTAEGEPLFNLENVVLACRDFAKIRNAEIIITSTFPLGPLRKLNDLYSDLEKLTLYWSAIALNQKVREWLMPGTTGESIPEIRDLVTEFSHKLGTRPTASFSLFEVNSSDKDIDLILKFFDGQQDWWRIKFMLGLPGSLEGYSDVHEERMLEINDRVSKAGFDSRTRTIYGIEEFSGCGNTLDERTRRGLNPYAPPMSKAG